MARISSFPRGGVHPHDKKELAKNSKIERLPNPEEIVVSLSQHLGAPATALKKKGDAVTMGEKIGQASSFISADVHSPFSGTVVDVKKERLPSGAVADALVIKVDADQPIMFTEKLDWQNRDASELLAQVKDNGIVGLGGATFPTSVKLSVPLGKSVEYFVVNGVECEPYLTADYRSMMERAEETLEGCMIAKKITGAEHVIIGIELNKKDAIEYLEKVIAEKGYPIEVVGLKLKYPQGDEKQLLKATIKREIPSGKLPLDVGAVVANIGTVFAIYEAVVYNKPLFERIITVTGEMINTPKNFLAPIGTKVSALIEAAGGLKDEDAKLVSGGPMMGFAFSSLDTPMIKGSSGLLALENKAPVKQQPCVSCAKCVQACPMGLMPNRMFKAISYAEYDSAMKIGLMDCKECGCCSFECPSHIPLVQGFKLGKKMGRKTK